jgi:hypothetical protein
MPRRKFQSYAPRGEAAEAQAPGLNPEYQAIWASRCRGLIKVMNRADYSEDDDLGLWRLAITEIVGENLAYYHDSKVKDAILIRVGKCSHWIRPHQSRYKVAGGFAAPFGYGNAGQGYSFSADPELEWHFTWTWSEEQSNWVGVRGRPGRRPLMLRISIPARTLRHEQAAVHAAWDPGTPGNPKEKATQLYFFRRFDREWSRVGDWIHDE